MALVCSPGDWCAQASDVGPPPATVTADHRQCEVMRSAMTVKACGGLWAPTRREVLHTSSPCAACAHACEAQKNGYELGGEWVPLSPERIQEILAIRVRMREHVWLRVLTVLCAILDR